MKEKVYFILVDRLEGDGQYDEENDRFGVMYKTTNHEHAVAFCESFKKGLEGFFVEREGKILNAFRVHVKDDDWFSKYFLGEGKIDLIPEVPPPNELYSKKVMVFDFEAGGRRPRVPLALNRFFFKNGYNKCFTVAALIADKIADPDGEFENHGDERKFGQQLLSVGWEILPAVNSLCMDQLYILTDIENHDSDPNSITRTKYEGSAIKRIEEVYGRG